MVGLTKRKLPTGKNKLKLNKEPLTWNPNTQRIHLSVEYHVLSTIFPFKITPCDDVSNKQTTTKNIDRTSYTQNIHTIFVYGMYISSVKMKNCLPKNYMYIMFLKPFLYTKHLADNTFHIFHQTYTQYYFSTILVPVMYRLQWWKTTWKSFRRNNNNSRKLELNTHTWILHNWRARRSFRF